MDRDQLRKCGFLGVAALTVCLPIAARAELAVSANDGKQLRAGDPTPVTPDSLSVIEIGRDSVRVLGTVPVPASMIGPPTAVAMAPDARFAIVAAAQKVNPDDPDKPLADNKVSVVDLRTPSRPRVVQTLAAGMGASGVSINAAGNLALVANKGDDTISVYTLASGRLSPVSTVQLDAKAAPTDVVFAPDGRHAYVVSQGASKIEELAVDGKAVTRTGNAVTPGRMPYGAVVTPDNGYAINTNLGGAMDAAASGPRGRRVGTISMIDLKTHTLVASAEVGQTPEHVALSPDGQYAAVVVANGTASAKSDPNFAKVLGILRIFRVGQGTLTELAKADTGHWGQGVTWSNDGKRLLLQCATEREIELFRFDGTTLTQDAAAPLMIESRPGAIVTALSR